MSALMAADLRVTALSVTDNVTGALTLQAANGSSASASRPGDRLFGWLLRGFLTPGPDIGGPLAILRYDSERWGMVAFLGTKGRLAPLGVSGGRLLRKGVGHTDAIRRPHFNLVSVDPMYYAKAVSDPGDFIRQGMEHDSAFNESTFAAAASRLPPPHDYAIVGNIER